MAKHKTKSKMKKGKGLKKFLKKTKILSRIGEKALPALGGTALGGLGTFVAPGYGSISGAALGGYTGHELNEYLKSQGYGKINVKPRSQYATGLKRSGAGIVQFGAGRITKRTEFAT